MRQHKPVYVYLFGAIAALGLAGCEQAEQAASEALENARQSAAQVLDEARQTGSIDQARQSASEVLNEARRAAAGLLGEAGEYLAAEPQGQRPETPAADDSPTAQ